MWEKFLEIQCWESEKLFVGERHSAKLSEGGKGKKEA